MSRNNESRGARRFITGRSPSHEIIDDILIVLIGALVGALVGAGTTYTWLTSFLFSNF